MREKAMAILLIFIGLLLLLSNFGILSGNLFLLIISAIFLFSYYRFNRNIGFLIPGCILLSIALFNILQSLYTINPVYIISFIGFGFLMIFFIHSSKKEYSYAEKYWSIYPGIILISFGIILGLISKSPEYIRYLFPILLIIIGALLLFRSIK
uniref:DUF5668 domain-containing protein n=1 Tax=Dictyoglomus thermophilum TaxID=14 RepID=A0A7C3MJA6_DICTH